MDDSAIPSISQDMRELLNGFRLLASRYVDLRVYSSVDPQIRLDQLRREAADMSGIEDEETREAQVF